MLPYKLLYAMVSFGLLNCTEEYLLEFLLEFIRKRANSNEGG